MKALVYVEGKTDQTGLEVLLRSLIVAREAEGVGIRFFPARQSDAKKWLLLNGPTVAAQILSKDPESHVAIVPDLYPRNKAFPHETQEELESSLHDRIRAELHRMRCDDSRVLDRFHAFCFKYEFEVLVLACEDLLKAYLHCEEFKVKWTRPVEQQDHERPPKAVLRELFAAHDVKYQGLLTPVEILERSDYRRLCDACPASLGRLVSWLNAIGA